MFVKITFTSLLLPTLVIIPILTIIFFMHLPFQKVKKNIVWGRYIDCDNRHFFLYIDFHRNYGVVVILWSFLYNYDNLTLKLHHKKRSYPDERWLFIGRFKVGSVPGKSVALASSKKVSKSIISMMQGH